jgi:hypothetical protein
MNISSTINISRCWLVALSVLCVSSASSQQPVPIDEWPDEIREFTALQSSAYAGTLDLGELSRKLIEDFGAPGSAMKLELSVPLVRNDRVLVDDATMAGLPGGAPPAQQAGSGTAARAPGDEHQRFTRSSVITVPFDIPDDPGSATTAAAEIERTGRRLAVRGQAGPGSAKTPNCSGLAVDSAIELTNRFSCVGQVSHVYRCAASSGGGDHRNAWTLTERRLSAGTDVDDGC